LVELIGEFGLGAESVADGFIGRSTSERTLAACIVGDVIAAEQAFEVVVGGDRDGQNLASDAAVEALDHAVGFGRIGFGFAVVDAQGAAGFLEAVSGETAAAISQHMSHLEGEGGHRLGEESGGAGLGFLVLDGEVDPARSAVNSDIEGQ
jgi:hypothetical protein